MENWVWEFAYENWRVPELKETLFWYANTGQAISHEETTARWIREIKAHGSSRLPRPPRRRWTSITEIAPRLRAAATTAFGWFTGGQAIQAWRDLDKIAYVGPKIAAWILRDLSFLRDYSVDTGKVRVRYKSHRDPSWFRRLPISQQAVFLPLDRWVIRGAKKRGVLPATARMSVIQGDSDAYLEAATCLVRAARNEGLDPRDVDVYLYLAGLYRLDALS
jgi:hypothetical protein